MAVQILYQYQFNDQKDVLEVMNETIDNYLLDEKIEDPTSYRKKIDHEFLENLLTGILLVLEKIDDKIVKLLTKNRKIEDLPEVMTQILRLGAFELQFMKNNPPKVVINEYVDITNSFFEEKKVNFVNAILDKISKE